MKDGKIIHTKKISFIVTLILIVLGSNKPCYAVQKQEPVISFARQQIEKKQYQPAISTLNSFLETHKNDTAALYLKAYSFQKLKNNLAAIENYLLLLKIEPKCFAANLDLANIYVSQKKYNEALPYYNKAVSLNDSDLNLLNSRGMCYYYNDRFELAIRDFKRVLRFDPNNYSAYNNLGSATYNNQNIASASTIDLNSAEKLFDKALELKPDFELAVRNRGIVRYYLDKTDLAYKDLLYATQLDPNDENAQYYLGKVLYKQKNYPIALQFFDNAINLSKTRTEFFLDRGICKLDMEDIKAARSDFYKAFQIGDEKGYAAYQLARTYGAEADKSNAFNYLREAKKRGLFVDTRYFNAIAKDKYFVGWEKDKDFYDLMQELKFGKR